jgi:hypothetical protein
MARWRRGVGGERDGENQRIAAAGLQPEIVRGGFGQLARALPATFT